MAEASIRDLRNRGGDIIDRVLAGERITVTRDGRAVAELRPLTRPQLSAQAIIERFRRLAPIDAVQFRLDVDAIVDQTI